MAGLFRHDRTRQFPIAQDRRAVVISRISSMSWATRITLAPSATTLRTSENN
ncbi:MAG: hypothetical protein R3D81_17235 [Thalassovita sp.]